jgi:hypothetical protein
MAARRSVIEKALEGNNKQLTGREQVKFTNSELLSYEGNHGS